MSSDSLGLTGKVVLVTGAAGGIGRATAQVLAAEGCRVVLADLRSDACAAVLAGLRGGPAAHRVVPLDLGDRASCEAAVAAATAGGRLDALVNCAALLIREPTDQAKPESVRRLFDVNAAGAFYIARAAAAAMRPHRSGRIVLFTSGAAFAGAAHEATAYAMTKGAVVSLMKSLARELAGSGICVNAISPGTIDTPMIRDTTPAYVVERLAAQIPLGRLGRPEDVARVCAFLVSDWASYITGQTIDVNGGQLMR